MIYKIIRPIIFLLKPELSHELAKAFLKYLPNLTTLFCFNKKYDNLKNKVWDIDFDNPVGLAAGFDKNAELVLILSKFGFGFIEVGTVTLKPQKGNVKPRVFRLKKDKALINRLGFNNLGCNLADSNICKIHHYEHFHPKIDKTILGVNIGKNKETDDYIHDYIELLEHFYIKSSYITINISSPNTKNLRDIQKQDNLDYFLKEIMKVKRDLKAKCLRDVPILLKIAPDLSLKEQKEIAEIVLHHKIDGLIISNTTIDRNLGLCSKNKNEQGGLSGKPLFDKSNEILANFYKLTKGQIPIIGVGGITNANDAYTKIKLGASLVQIYTGFIYEGFSLVEKIKKDLSILIKNDGYKNINEAIGASFNNKN